MKVGEFRYHGRLTIEEENRDVEEESAVLHAFAGGEPILFCPLIH